jgi:isoquinoline 1-oxidoreductase beta subunit
MVKITRRGFLISGALVGGGLFLGISYYTNRKPVLRPGPGESVMNAWLKITEDNRVIAVVPQAEMGQGVFTSLPMLVAEELGAEWSQVEFEAAPVDPLYANAALITASIEENEAMPEAFKEIGLWAARGLAAVIGIQATGGSTSIRNFWLPLRQVAAAAREMLIAAAAERWNVRPGQCHVEAGHVVLNEGGERFSFGDLAGLAAELSPPSDPALKGPKDYKFIGRPLKRLDTPDKVTGKAEFGIDVRLPGLLYAAIRAAPVFGRRLGGYDDSKAGSMPGVAAIVALDDALAVVAEHYWQAKTALDAIPVQFASPESPVSTDQLFADYRAALEDPDAYEYEKRGRPKKLFAAMPEGSREISALYEVPYLAHACMEPMNCTADVRPGTCEIWAPTQSATIARDAAADLLDFDAEQVELHTTYLGGGFGRRVETDSVRQAVLLSKAVGRPVQVIWSREEDVRHDFYRPMAVGRLKGILGDDGEVWAVAVRSASQSVIGSFVGRLAPFAATSEPDPSSVEGLAFSPYGFSNYLVEHRLMETPVPVGFWRSVGHSINAFFMESFVDQLAAEAGRDPFDLRMELLAKRPRFRAVLERLKRESKFGQWSGQGRGQGLAIHRSFGTIVGQVADVTMTGEGVRVERVTCVVDCGQVVNPSILEAQMESGIIFGLTAAFFGQISIEEGAARESNFHDYDMLRIGNTPRIETHIMASTEPPGGAGEPGTPPAAPTLTNAIFAASGRRLTRLPLAAEGLGPL